MGVHGLRIDTSACQLVGQSGPLFTLDRVPKPGDSAFWIWLQARSSSQIGLRARKYSQMAA